MIEIIQKVIAGDSPVFLLICGPNGAGKSTFRQKRLDPLGFPCIDPDAVALSLYGRHPTTRQEAIKATQEATDQVLRHFRNQMSVGLETVFSDSKGHKLGLLKEATKQGFKTVIVFIGVDHPQISIARVMDRVEQGGHDVPDEIIEDRFPRCFENLKCALTLVDLVLLIDNSGAYELSDSTMGLRHYVFGLIKNGKIAKITNPVPHWFSQLKILD